MTNTTGQFYNRHSELEALHKRWIDPKPQLLLLYGRRRIGKTYLLEHFLSSEKPHAYFLAAKTSLSENISQLSGSVLSAFPGSGYSPEDFPTLRGILGFISNMARDKRIALVLDEFQYLVEQDPSIPSQVQAWWDTDGNKSKIFLVLCGSQLGVMEGLGGPQAPLFGRFTFRYKLLPMNYLDISCFYSESNYSVRDKLTAFGVLGGTPRYHAIFDPNHSLGENIADHILSPMGVLHNEPEILMSSSRIRDAAPYNTVLRAIAEGNTKFNDIANKVGVTSPQLAAYIKILIELEWIKREYPFDDTSERRVLYRIADHFIRFWYRFTAELRSRLEVKDPMQVFKNNVEPYLNDYMGFLAFEDICHQYLQIKEAELTGDEIVKAGRYWSRDGSLEIDIAAELVDGHYLFGECKWSSSPVGIGVYYELREKVARLPDQKYKDNPRYIIFSLAGFKDDLKNAAAKEGLLLVSGEDLLETK